MSGTDMGSDAIRKQAVVHTVVRACVGWRVPSRIVPYASATRRCKFHTDIACYAHIVLRARYAVSGTDVGYAATRSSIFGYEIKISTDNKATFQV
eukprot:1696934-Rhodomonas_salina.3